jgi:hypothetical protein
MNWGRFIKLYQTLPKVHHDMLNNNQSIYHKAQCRNMKQLL